MKLHLPYLLRRSVVRALFAAATVVTTLASATHAEMITPDGRTATQVIQSGNVYDVYTNTVRGSTGFNSFSTFDVYAETTANLHLADGTGRLINVVRDSSSHIDGVLNSYKGGRIGGDVYFLNPNGIIVGKTGVINVGSISMSTPTAAFVEQLIARDGSISPTATQAVLAGDMPINEKGSISIKGKVNARNSVEMRAGKVEVKGGEINTDVRFHEMVNSGGRKVGAKGMSIQDGRLSFGKKPAKARRAVAKAKERKAEKKADIAIFADDVLVDGGALNADWVYIDPDTASLVNSAISGDYTLEARVIVLDNVRVKEGETLTSFTLYAANELADGTYEGNVSITLSNSNIVADEVNITASATTNAAEAIVSITGSTLAAAQDVGSIAVYAISESGNSRVDIRRSTLTAGNGVEAAALSVQGNAALTLDAPSTITADIVTLAAAASAGNADVSVQGKVSGGSAVSLYAATGNTSSEYEEDQDISEVELTPEGGGNASVTVDGTVEAKGALTVEAYAMGTYGDTTVNINGNLSSMATETKQIGELGLERTEAETANETDTEDSVNAKNAAYLDRYVAYLKTLPTATAATGTIAIEASSTSGNVTFTQAAGSQLTSSLSASISADAAQAASVTLAGRTTSGDISATAKGETSTLRTVQRSVLMAGPHQCFVQDGTVVSVEKANGSIALEAGTHDDDNPNPDAPVPEKRNGVLLEVAGALAAQRGKADEAGEGGAISLVSAGKLTVGKTAAAVATSANGKGGLIYLDAPEYEILANAANFRVDGSTESGLVLLMNHEELTGDNINNVDDISANFLQSTLNPSLANNANGPSDDFRNWNVGYTRVTLSGHIKLTGDVNASLSTTAIANDTVIDCDGHSLTLTNSSLHHFNFGALIAIGNNVEIKNAKDFTLDWNYESVMERVLNSYFGSSTQLTVGENFTVKASGNVAITLAGMYNTAITFGKGVNITADGDVTIGTMTRNGMGISFLNTANTKVVSAFFKLIPSLQDNPAAKAASEALSLVRFNTDKIIAKLLEKTGKGIGDGAKNILSIFQVGVRSSYASVIFADNGTKTKEGQTVNAGSITGSSVTISAKSTASVTGRKRAKDNTFGLSVGIVNNESKVDLGDHLTITATGKGTGEEKGQVSITSTTKSKVNLEYLYDPPEQKLALGILLSLGFDSNAVTVKDNVTINADQGINIGAKSDIAAKPFMTLSKGQEKEFAKDVVDGNGRVNAYAADTSVLVMLGVNVLRHTSETTIAGNLTSTHKDINMTSGVTIDSSLTMNGSVRNTLGISKPEAKDQDNSLDFLDYLGGCFSLNFGFGVLGQKDDGSWAVKEFDEYFSYANRGKAAFEKLRDFRKSSTEAEVCVDVAIAADIVVSRNALTFNGQANAVEGSVKVDANSSIEAACGAETSIVGIPAKTAVAGCISVPVVDSSTTAQIGSKAVITAGTDITVSSSTTLPMSLDPVGWQGWQDFAKAEAGAAKANEFFKALRGNLTYIADYYDNGELGILDGMTSSHASTYMRKTGGGNKSYAIGGDFVFDIRNIDTKTIVQDGAKLTASGNLSLNSLTKGKQASVAGRLPAFFSAAYSVFMSEKHASSGFGFSTIVGKKTINTVTYIGAATLKASELNVDATGDVFMLELSVAGTADAADNAAQGGLNLIWENRMTVSEISNGASITLTGKKAKDKASSITANDKSTLINLSGMVADAKGTAALGVGVAITVNSAFTAAMLGNNLAIPASYSETWKAMIGAPDTTFKGSKPITLTFNGDRAFKVHADDASFLLTVGIAGAIQRGKDGGQGAGVAANVAVISNTSETTARQYNVNATFEQNGDDITTQAEERSTIVSVAGDAAINTTGNKDAVLGAGAVSSITGNMDTTAYVTDSSYKPGKLPVIDPKTGKQKIDKQGNLEFIDGTLGKFKVDTSNKATAVAVDVAAGIGAATAGIAAGLSIIQMGGNTGSYLIGGSVNAGSVEVTSLTDLTSCSVTLGAAVNISLNAKGESGNKDNEEMRGEVAQQINGNLIDENEIPEMFGEKDDEDGNANNQNDNSIVLHQQPSGEQEEVVEFGKKLSNGAGSPALLGAGDGGVSFDFGASIAHNRMDMRSSAIVEGCTITTPGALTVTAEDTSVITAVSVGAAATHAGGTSIGAGGVFSFAPVNSITEAIIRQKSGVSDKLKIQAGSLTLKATDNHRERVWSLGGGYGDTAGIGMVLSWGSYAGATTMALVEKVDAEIAGKVDILASSTLDSFFLALGGSGSKGGVVSLTGMVNYMNFNNSVVTDIRESTLTVTDTKNGSFTAKAYGKRTFTDGVGSLDVHIGGKDKIGAGGGAALSFVYVGGNGANDTNLTQLLVTGSEINNAGKTDLLAESHTEGLMAVANAGVDVSIGGIGIAANGSVGLLNDASLTQVDITGTVFNKKDLRAKPTDSNPCENAAITAEAKSDSKLTLGMGTLGVQIGKGAGIGASVGLLKDQAATMATMTGGGVLSARDFTLHADGRTDLAGLVIGGGGSGTIGLAGGAMRGTIAHTVVAKLENSFMDDLKGALTIKADNTSNVGKDQGPRFTVVNGAVGLFGGGVGADVSIIDVADVVQANAHNVSVHAGSMDVLANEHSYADAVTVSVAGGQYAGVEVNVVLPVLRGDAQASVTADKEELDPTHKVGITTTGDLSVEAANNQWMRSHLWAFTLTVNPTPGQGSLSATVCVNSINLAGSSDARIAGSLTLNVGGNLNIKAETEREATYTTVPVALAIAPIGVAGTVDVNSLRVSNDTSPLNAEQDSIKQGMTAIDNELKDVLALINKANVKVDKDAQITLSGDVATAMKDAVNSVGKITDPKTSAALDLGKKDAKGDLVAGTANVGGSVTIQAKDKVTTTPTRVHVTGGVVSVGVHITSTSVGSTAQAIVKDTELTAGGNISIDAEQEHADTFLDIGLTVGVGGSATVAVYNWKDTATEKTLLQGKTSLTSSNGSINIGTSSNTSEELFHENINLSGLVNILFVFPTFTQNETNTIDIASGVNIAAAGDVTIGTRSYCFLDVNTFDLASGLGALDVGKSAVDLKTTQNLSTGEGVTIKGGSVDIRQNATRDIDYLTSHANAAVASLAFPFVSIYDTVNATLTIGKKNEITATSGALTIESAATANANPRFYGVNAGGLSVGVAANSFTETITNKIGLGDDVKLSAKDSTVRAKSTHTGELKGNNIAGNLLSVDILNTYNNANATSEVTIGTGFEATGVPGADGKPATGHSLTLEALNTDNFLCRAEKVTISLLLAPYSRNAFHTEGKSTATVTLGGGDIDVQDFNAKATTDVSVKVQQRLAGGSVVENTNTGAANNDIKQTATVTLGTGTNALRILTDNVSVIAHNKYLFDRLDTVANTMVYGASAALISVTDALVSAKQTETATVTLGSGAKIERRMDLAHYRDRDKYKTLISATNNVESNTSLDLLGGGLFANLSLVTQDETTAKATLTLHGGIDTWGNTELTAYSHARHNMRNTAQTGGIPLNTANLSYPSNMISTIDTVNINGTVESTGNITIQSGSTKGEYRLADGAVVLAGEDDTNSTSYNYGKSKAKIENIRTEKVAFGDQAKVRAGGELSIYNDSSANTAKKPFKKTGTADDYSRGAIDTAAEVTSTVAMGTNTQLSAGLGSAVKMIFQKGTDQNQATMQFLSAQRLFAEQKETEQGSGIWLMTTSVWTASIYEIIRPDAGTVGKNLLSIHELTLPGMAFRIVSDSNNLNTFKGKLYSPAKHGLDIFIAADWTGDVKTCGATLQGHETGLIFNFQSKKDIVQACAGPDLYLAEGVSIRSQAEGNLTITGAYQFPYSTFLATSDHDLSIKGNVYCGNTVFEAGGSFTVDKPDSDYSLRSALSMYEGLFKEWEGSILGKVKTHADEVYEASGNKQAQAKVGVYKTQPYNNIDKEGKLGYTAQKIADAVENASAGKESSINAMGTVTINAKVVDLNGKIKSGLLNSDIVIDPGFHVLTNDGKSITRQAADALYKQDGTTQIFKLDGYSGISLVYNAGTKEISLNSFEALPSGITITGNIVNSNPTGDAGLYVAGPDRPLAITNNSGLTLNIGNIDLTSNSTTSGITLNNTYTQKATTYTLENGQWKMKECALKLQDGKWVQQPGGTFTTVDPSSSVSYTGVSNYQVELTGTMKIGMTETGRLTHEGDIGDIAKTYETYKFIENDSAGLIGKQGNPKQTIIDEITVNTKGVQYGNLTSSYVVYANEHKNGYACSESAAPTKKVTRIYDAGTAYRWQYTLEYDELVTAKLYVSAANSVAINLGGVGSTAGLGITSGNVNFTGKVNAASCTVNASDAITATGGALVTSATIDMTATKGSIGGSLDASGNKVALAFNAGTATFTAGQDIYLSHVSTEARPDIGKLELNAGKALELRSGGAIKDLQLTASESATVEARGGINVTGGYIGDTASIYPARISLGSETGDVSVAGGDFTRGIFTVQAQGNVSINSTAAGDLTIDYVESRGGNVNIAAQGNILTVHGADMSNPESSLGALQETVAEDFYQLLLQYETLYYEKDKDGNYTHRTADGILVLPEKEAEIASLGKTLKELYDAGRGDELGDMVMFLSGTEAVEGTVFKDTADALAYLAKHADKLEPVFVRAYYDKMMVELTNEIHAMHGPERNIDYGDFNEAVYRLYWLRDCNGKLVHQDSRGNFISPTRADTDEALYSPEMCAAITKQFLNQPARGGNTPYRVADSALFQRLANTGDVNRVELQRMEKMEDGLASLVGGQAVGDMYTAIKAEKGTVSLTALNGQGDIGGGSFHFTIKPIEKANGKFVYSAWAQAFIDSAEKGIWPGIGAVTKNEGTGEYQVTLSFIEFSLSGFNKLNNAFMQRALPMDVEWFRGLDLYRVHLRNYIGVDAGEIKAQGRNVLLASNRDITLDGKGITAQNLFLSTTGAISGAWEKTGAGEVANLYADKGIGTTDNYFRIGGGSTFTLGSLGDVYVKPIDTVKVSSITGKRVTVDSRSGQLVPIPQTVSANQPNIIGQRIDFYGDLDTGLNFRTTGTSLDEGGLHWHGGGSSNDLAFGALNTAYTFWFVNESGSDALGDINVNYSGYLEVHGLAQSGNATFKQTGKSTSMNAVNFVDKQTFNSLTLGGDTSYTVQASGGVLLGSSTPLSVGGRATLSFAGFGSTQGDAVSINSTGDLAIASCEVASDLVVNSTGNVSLADVRLGGEASIAGDTVSLNGTSGAQKLVLNGSNGVTGTDVSSSQIVANSSNAGVFLNSTSTNSLSGSSRKSFVASVQALDGTAGVTVGNVSASGFTSKVIIQAITDQLVLDGYISGAALEFYSTGAIDEKTGAMLLSAYPFWDVWQSGDPEVWKLAIETLESDLMEGYIWLVEEVESLADKSCDSVDELRRKVNAGGQPHSAAPLRFKDRKGNTVSRNQFANLITSK